MFYFLFFFFFQAEDGIRDVAVTGVQTCALPISPGRGGELGCQAQQVLKKFVRLASAFPSPPTRSLSNRKGRGRRRGGREREPRRAGEGRCLELNSCVLIDYRLWAAKSEGRQWVEHCIEQCIEHPPEPRSGLCPELLADFRIPNLLGARRGAEGSFLCSPSSRFSGRGGGVGSPPGRDGGVGGRGWRRHMSSICSERSMIVMAASG